MRLKTTLSIFLSAACLCWHALLCSASDSLLERHGESDVSDSDGPIVQVSTSRGLKKSKSGKSYKSEAYYRPSYMYHRPYVPVYGGYGENGGYGGYYGGYGGYGSYDYSDFESGSKKSKSYKQYPVIYNTKSAKKIKRYINYVVETPVRPPAARDATQTIYEIISEIVNLSTLASLVSSRGQEEILQTLDGEGPVTLFAPLDSAFDALFADVQPSSITDEELSNTLNYHIVAGRLLKRHLIMGGRGVIYSLNGDTIAYKVNGRQVILNNEALIIKGNIRATNGVIHVIDRVLLPGPSDTIAAKLEEAGNFNTLLELLRATDLLELFEDPNGGPYTLFAPTDEAFAALLAETGFTIPQLITDFAALTSILLYHVVDGVFTSADLADVNSLESVEGESIAVDGTTLNSEAEIIEADILASNGIIHTIDAVLVPSEDGAATSPPTRDNNDTETPSPTVVEPETPSPTEAAGGLDTPSPTDFNATDVTLEPTISDSTLEPTVADIGGGDNSTNTTNLLDDVSDTINNIGDALGQAGGNIGGGTNAEARGEDIQL